MQTLRVLLKKTHKLCDVTINLDKEVKEMTPNLLTQPLLCVPNRIKQLNNRIISSSCCFCPLNDSDESLSLSLKKVLSQWTSQTTSWKRVGEAAALSHDKRKDKNSFTLFIIYDPQKMAKKFISDSLNSANRCGLCWKIGIKCCFCPVNWFLNDSPVTANLCGAAEAARRYFDHTCPTSSREVMRTQNHCRCRWIWALSRLPSNSTIAPHPQWETKFALPGKPQLNCQQWLSKGSHFVSLTALPLGTQKIYTCREIWQQSRLQNKTNVLFF